MIGKNIDIKPESAIQNIEVLFSELKKACNEIPDCHWRLIFIDDGSKDDTSNLINSKFNNFYTYYNVEKRQI